MRRSSGAALGALLLGTILARAQVEDAGLTGRVLDPEGMPVARGTVAMQPFGGRASIDEEGRFRVVPNTSGVRQLAVSVPGFAPYRVSVDVPRSKALKLPDITLSRATYFRARFVTAAGEPMIAPQLRRRSFDAAGEIAALPDDRPSQMDSDGALTVGPLPRGITTMAIDTPPLAQTRLPDLSVSGEKELFDLGTIVVQPGAVLQVDVVDQSGAPVKRHEVFIEDVRPRSPLNFPPVRTDERGRAVFDRLSAGQYRLRTETAERCKTALLTIAPLVQVPGGATVRTRIIVGGHAAFRIESPLGPLSGIAVSASPEAVPPASSIIRRPIGGGVCGGSTDKDGRLTLENFPPGPTRVNVRLINSTFQRRVDVPIDGTEIPIVVPEGFLPVRVVDGEKNDPISGATISWTTTGGRVESTSSGAGDALLDAVGVAGGTLAVEKAGYSSAQETFAEPPGVLHDIVLARTPTVDRRVEARVVTADGEPVPDAVVEISSRDPMQIPHIAVTDQRGVVRFSDAPPGSLRLTAGADGFATASIAVAESHRTDIVVTIARTP